ncbi:MAG: Ig-like domain-containing protein [Verrucomicrobiae bacterium]|nr:Ig-like domain-containing protein [Verrucomicrobiae bacterium]
MFPALLLALASLPLLSLRAADAGLCVVFKGFFYQQTGQNTVTPKAGTQFASFRAFAQMTAPGSLLSGTVRTPANQTFSLAVDENELRFGMDFNSQATMDATFGSGNYVLGIATRNDGNRVFTLNLSGNSYPPIPQVSNYQALQAVNPASPLTLQWLPWSGGTTNDLILVQIEDSETWDMVFSTPLPSSPGALNGTATSVTIPANTCSANRSYNVLLMFFRPVTMDVTTYPGVMAVSGYLRETELTLSTGAGLDNQAPWLEDQAPRYGETNVARNAGIAFIFSEPMQASYSIQWNPALSLNYQWNSNRTVLFCFPASGLLPTNTTINYTLNPPGQTGFRDLAGNALPTIQGYFTTGNQTVSLDVKAYVLFKYASYQQTGPTNPIPATFEPPFGFESGVMLNAPATVTNVILIGPNTMAMRFNGDDWGGVFQASRLADVDAAYPPGTYTFRIQTVHDGFRQVALNLPATALPSAPRLINFNAAQAIDPNAPFTLQWEPFAGATTNDRIEVEIDLETPWTQRTVFSSPDPLSPNALNGLATSLQIPAGTLPAGRTFTAYINFIKVVSYDITSYPGAVGVVAFGAFTTFPLATTGQPARTTFRTIRHFGNYVRLEIQGERETPCTVEFTENFRQWYPLRSDWNQSGTLFIEDWNLSPMRRFYRVREGW